jgi:hypothetical protein
MSETVYRRDDVKRGVVYFMPHGSRAVHMVTGEETSLPRGIYAHPLDQRTDDELRQMFDGDAALL